jgi:hypothetical protein
VKCGKPVIFSRLPYVFHNILTDKNILMIVNENNSMPYMKSLSSCLEIMIEQGYTDDFKAIPGGLKSLRTDKVYQPHEVRIANFYRFEGASDPDDMSILYAIEANDGLKGTLVDAFGTYADADVNNFILEVENIQKKTTEPVA